MMCEHKRLEPSLNNEFLYCMDCEMKWKLSHYDLDGDVQTYFEQEEARND